MDDRARRIPLGQMFDLWSHLARELRTPGLPVALAEETRLEDLDLLGFVLLTAPTGLRALETFVAYSGLLNDGTRWQLDVSAQLVEVRLACEVPRALGVRLSLETAFAQATAGVRQLLGASLDPLAVSFRHAAPSDTREHRALFRCPLKFGAPRDRLVFARDPFDAAPRGANAALWTYLRAQADAGLHDLAPRPLSVLAEEEVRRCVADGASPELEVVARTLGTSARTLRRALAATGTTFRQTADRVRRDRARTLLEEGPISITHTAFDLGFSDVAAFSHACRRWFGRAPSAFVKRGGA